MILNILLTEFEIPLSGLLHPNLRLLSEAYQNSFPYFYFKPNFSHTKSSFLYIEITGFTVSQSLKILYREASHFKFRIPNTYLEIKVLNFGAHKSVHVLP